MPPWPFTGRGLPVLRGQGVPQHVQRAAARSAVKPPLEPVPCLGRSRCQQGGGALDATSRGRRGSRPRPIDVGVCLGSGNSSPRCDKLWDALTGWSGGCTARLFLSFILGPILGSIRNGLLAAQNGSGLSLLPLRLQAVWRGNSYPRQSCVHHAQQMGGQKEAVATPASRMDSCSESFFE